MRTWRKTSSVLVRKYLFLLEGLHGYVYHFRRFIFYGGWRLNMRDVDQRNYHLARICHSLEKSMSFKERKANSGWRKVENMLGILEVASRSRTLGYHDRAATSLVSQFCMFPGNRERPESARHHEQLLRLGLPSSNSKHGIRICEADELQHGLLQDPEKFFLSRYSVREFSHEPISDTTVERVIRLAMKSPSVCNRQAWHVYFTGDRDTIDAALEWQSGNRGFGDRVPYLFMVASDLRGFIPGREHYQHWIDGGMFSMSLVYALHALGVASCCLNWSQTPRNDRRLRNSLRIDSHHTIIMMIAFGLPAEKNHVCISARRPVDEVLSRLAKS